MSCGIRIPGYFASRNVYKPIRTQKPIKMDIFNQDNGFFGISYNISDQDLKCRACEICGTENHSFVFNYIESQRVQTFMRSLTANQDSNVIKEFMDYCHSQSLFTFNYFCHVCLINFKYNWDMIDVSRAESIAKSHNECLKTLSHGNGLANFESLWLNLTFEFNGLNDEILKDVKKSYLKHKYGLLYYYYQNLMSWMGYSDK